MSNITGEGKKNMADTHIDPPLIHFSNDQLVNEENKVIDSLWYKLDQALKTSDNKDRINFLQVRGKEIIQEIIKRRDIDINHAQTVRDMYQDERDATKKECDTLKISNKFLDESYQKCLNDRQKLIRRFENQKKVLEELQEKCKNFQEICAALQKQIRPYLESNNELKNRVTRLEEELVRETARKDHWKNHCDARDLNIRNLHKQIRLNGIQIQDERVC